MTERSKVLTLAANLELPLDAATRRLAILAMSGAGKSNVAVVLAEQMADAGIPWVAIDPKGDWWGVRSSKSGKGPGLQIPILGGSHGDVPLEPGAGKVIADLIHAQRLTCVLDVSEFDERQQLWGFLADFGNELLRLHKRTPQVHHLFLEECDEYIPQKASEKGNQVKCLGVWQRVVKKGRTLGLGSTQITQRNASLNKDTLYMAELLIAMRVTGKGDREAVRGWVEYHNASDEIVDSLPTLQDGEGWVSSPAWLRETKRVRFHRRRTFDSGSTPVLLEGAAPAATLADVDLEALRTRMATTIEKAKADDPAELRKRIAQLERELKAKPAAAPATVTREQIVEMRVEVPILTAPQVQKLEAAVARIQKALEQAAGAVDRLVIERGELGKIGHEIQVAIAQACGPTSQARRVQTSAVAPGRVSPPQTRPQNPTSPTRLLRLPSGSATGVEIGKGERACLIAIAQHDQGVTREQLTVLTGYKRSTRNTYLQRLGSWGYIAEQGDVVHATATGVAVLGSDFEILPTGTALLEHWRGRLPKGERECLEVAIAAYPDGVPRDAISEATGFARSSRNTYLQRLSARKLVEFSGDSVRASAMLFD